jgi:ribosomal-protein-alanine N-acetyltransferase
MILLPSVRLARADEAVRIAEMSRRYIETGLGWSWTAARVRRAMADDATNVAVAHRDGRLLGFGIMQYGDEHAHLALLAVEPDQRQRGIGVQLLAWLEHCARVAGLQRIRLEARRDNAGALAFYAARGYRPTSIATGYYLGVLDAVRLEKTLVPAET